MYNIDTASIQHISSIDLCQVHPNDAQELPDDAQKLPDDAWKLTDDDRKLPDDTQKLPDDAHDIDYNLLSTVDCRKSMSQGPIQGGRTTLRRTFK